MTNLLRIKCSRHLINKGYPPISEAESLFIFVPKIVAFLLTKKAFGYILIGYTIIYGFSVVSPVFCRIREEWGSE